MARSRSGAAIGLGALLAAALGGCSPAADGERPGDPEASVEALLAADRAFSEASMTKDLVSGISAMLAEEVVMPAPPGRLVAGAAAVVAALRENPANAGARAGWTPMRGGVSADGQHGFTFGFLTVHRADGTVVPQKYMAYWIREEAGWRVAAYKRAARPEGEVSLSPMPPSLPERMVPPSADSARLESHRASLDLAEREFSREAQSIGLGRAFARFGSEDAVNMGSDPGFLVGAEAIGARMTADGAPDDSSPVSWAPERVIVASSGDLGVTIGFIRQNAAPPGSVPASIPFFTIWRRSGPDGSWRYVAE